jgi:hypothetical protein
MRIGGLLVMSALFLCACHQGHVRFAQTRVPVVFGDRDTIGAPPPPAEFIGKLVTSVGEGSGTQSTGAGTLVSWGWSRSTDALDRTVAQGTSGISPAAIRRLRIRADTRLASIGVSTAGSVTMYVSGDFVRVVPPPPAPASAIWPQEPSPAGPVAAADAGYVGTWEGPWDDAARGQHGRLYIDIRGDGVASGWMKFITSDNPCFVTGALRPGGMIDLACRCQTSPPFALRGALAVDPTGDVRGSLTFSTTGGVFGTPNVILKRFVR